MPVLETLAQWQREGIQALAAAPLVVGAFTRLDPTMKALLAVGVIYLAGVGSAAGFNRMVGLPRTVDHHDTRIDALEQQHDAFLLELVQNEERFGRVMCVLEAQVQAFELDIPLRTALDECRPPRPGLFDPPR